MKKIIAQRISLFLLLLIASSMHARLADWYYRENRCQQDFECSVNPLKCGAFGVQLQGGVYPIIWKKRSDSFIVNCTGFTNPVTIITDLGAFPKYNNLYKVSWV